jgi:hypothetical protein
MPFQRLPWISSLFHTVFQHKKFTFTARPLAHRSACQSAGKYECRADFSRIRLLCFIKAVKNNKLGSVKNSRGFTRTLQADFSKDFDRRFFNGVSDDSQKMLSKRQK